MKERESLFNMDIQQPEDRQQVCDDMSEAEIDETLAQSFPSSDPPSWTLGTDKRCEPFAKSESKLEP